MMAFDGTGGGCWEPDIPFQMDQDQRLRIAQFGDGYQQRTLDGINSLNSKWSLIFENRPTDVVLAMAAYLAERKGDSFAFLDPVQNITFMVFCDAWTVAWPIKRVRNGVREYYGTLTAEFVKANGVNV